MAAAADDHGGLPDKHCSLHMPSMSIEGKKLRKKVAGDLIMSDEFHDYSEIFSPNAEECNANFGGDQLESLVVNTRKVVSKVSNPQGVVRRAGSEDSGLTGLSSTETVEAGLVPPPPPIHRYPSWEDRIYQVASEGFLQGGGKAENIGEGGNTHISMCGGYGNDIAVPVYASVQGVRYSYELRGWYFTSSIHSGSSARWANPIHAVHWRLLRL